MPLSSIARPPKTWLPREPNVVALLEAAYRVDRDELAWSRGITEAFVQSVPGSAFFGGFVFDGASPGGLGARAMHTNSPEAEAWMRGAEPADMARWVDLLMPTHARSETARGVLGEEYAAFAATMRKTFPTLVDSWAVSGCNLSRQGFLLSATTSVPMGAFPAGLQGQWSSVAAHLSAAYCLRENLARGCAAAEGVFLPDGKVVHAEGAATSPSAREGLRLAVRGIDAARSRLRKQTSEVLQAWQAIVSERWSLVEVHEQDGRRILVARVNELAAPESKALSKRERQIVGLVAQGASNKEIAYRLGIGEPSVGGYLRRARQKLGLHGRAELARWVEAQPAPSPAAEQASRP